MPAGDAPPVESGAAGKQRARVEPFTFHLDPRYPVVRPAEPARVRPPCEPNLEQSRLAGSRATRVRYLAGHRAEPT